MVDLNFNTVLAPVSWELIEPKEGRFDFVVVDGLIQEARRHNLRLIFLMVRELEKRHVQLHSDWVKKGYRRFPRVKIQGREAVEVLSTLAKESWQADAKAFAALMSHIREVTATTTR